MATVIEKVPVTTDMTLVSSRELADLYIALADYKRMNRELSSFIHREMHKGMAEDTCNFRICQINRIFRGLMK